MRIKKGDNILIIRGKDRGKNGKVIRTFPKTEQLLIEGLNLKKIHKRPRREGEKGQTVEVAAPLHSALVKFICPKCNQPARLGYATKDNVKNRVCKKCKTEV
ncbi:50S ribosomal protein L24 [bacterium (Candidatus Gribaldobacteria) CG08_land_8_20_14_0_20_39_15]|uniref:Large ribosomal subunit protein uL24 n=1 Tax=bacterium (Candidatus Gribaldobacteria) CG08_land_8_20_14_0_20_39_15 TaxID=2014273 RepID=A0A2M6XUW1_9BACT|nr:MAG: 50S ribosomal protein L24 [bacterium (Candidatus Gribaldobacteria) CG08_land_8_20_14_0_20_39_15]